MLDNKLKRLDHSAMFFGNLNVVEEGRVYRAGRLSLEQFEKAIEVLDIKTLFRVVCLQRNNREYFRNIERICSEKGVKYAHASLTHNTVPDKQRLRLLLDVFKTAQYPLMIMCHRGADRSGLTSALYQMYRNRSRAEVMKQLSFYPDGHFWLMHWKYHVFLKKLFDNFGGDLNKYMESDSDFSATGPDAGCNGE